MLEYNAPHFQTAIIAANSLRSTLHRKRVKKENERLCVIRHPSGCEKV